MDLPSFLTQTDHYESIDPMHVASLVVRNKGHGPSGVLEKEAPAAGKTDAPGAAENISMALQHTLEPSVVRVKGWTESAR